ncbi:unnamed protein product [Lampetra planeri]
MREAESTVIRAATHVAKVYSLTEYSEDFQKTGIGGSVHPRIPTETLRETHASEFADHACAPRLPATALIVKLSRALGSKAKCELGSRVSTLGPQRNWTEPAPPRHGTSTTMASSGGQPEEGKGRVEGSPSGFERTLREEGRGAGVQVAIVTARAGHTDEDCACGDGDSSLAPRVLTSSSLSLGAETAMLLLRRRRRRRRRRRERRPKRNGAAAPPPVTEVRGQRRPVKRRPCPPPIYKPGAVASVAPPQASRAARGDRRGATGAPASSSLEGDPGLPAGPAWRWE